MTFFSMLPSGNKNSERKLNQIPYPVYTCLSGSAFLVSFTDPNKQLPNAKSVFNFLIVDLVCKKYIDLLLFMDRNIIY